MWVILYRIKSSRSATPYVRPYPIRSNLKYDLGSKPAEKSASSSASPSAAVSGRYRRLGKAQSHLEEGPPTRYQNKANLHAKRSAKRLYCSEPNTYRSDLGTTPSKSNRRSLRKKLPTYLWLPKPPETDFLPPERNLTSRILRKTPYLGPDHLNHL